MQAEQAQTMEAKTAYTAIAEMWDRLIQQFKDSPLFHKPGGRDTGPRDQGLG
jgi:hypothetical protein